MIKSLKVDYEVQNIFSQVNYLNFGGLFSGHFRKFFLYDKLAKDGGENTFASCEFIVKKHFENGSWKNADYVANFTLFIAKNGSAEYIDKNGEKGRYIDYLRLNAIGVVLKVDDLLLNTKECVEQIYNDNLQGLSLESALNKPLILGFSSEEYQGKKGVSTRILLDRVFNAKLQSANEQIENKEALEWHFFRPKHKALETSVSFSPNENQSFDPYKQETKEPSESKKQIDFNEAFTELRESETTFPF